MELFCVNFIEMFELNVLLNSYTLVEKSSFQKPINRFEISSVNI